MVFFKAIAIVAVLALVSASVSLPGAAASSTRTPTKVSPPAQQYVMAFHGCKPGAGDCNNPSSHEVYLAQSNDGASWSLLPGWEPRDGSVPDVFRRGDTLYVISTGGMSRLNMQTGDVTHEKVSIESGENYVDPSLAQLPDGRLVMFYLPGIMGQDPAACAPGEGSCTRQIKSAVEVPGSNGTVFRADSGVRVSETITGGTFSDPDIFFNGSEWVLYVSRGQSISSYTSADLQGTFSYRGPVSQSQGGVGSGIQASPGVVQTFAHASTRDSTVIVRGESATGTTPIATFATVITGPSIGLGNYVASPGVALNTPGITCGLCNASSSAQTSTVVKKRIKCVKGNKTKFVKGVKPKCPKGFKKVGKTVKL